MKCSIQRGEAELNGTFHLSPKENICSIARRHGMSCLIAAKCKTSTISNRRDTDGNHPPLHFFGVALEEADNVNLLGLTLNNKLVLEPSSHQNVYNSWSATRTPQKSFSLYFTCPEGHHLQSHDTIQNGIRQQCLDWC